MYNLFNEDIYCHCYYFDNKGLTYFCYCTGIYNEVYYFCKGVFVVGVFVVDCFVFLDIGCLYAYLPPAYNKYNYL